MSSKTDARIEALEVALNNESRERDFYLKHAERTSNSFGKMMFQSIAQDEEEHYQRILELHKKLQDEGRWPETIPLKVKGVDMKSVLKKVLDSIDTSAKADTDDMEAVKIAIDFETALTIPLKRNFTGCSLLWKGSTVFPSKILTTILRTPKGGIG